MTKAELIQSLETLKAGYIASLNSLQMMRGWGRAQLEALYAVKIGKFKVELLELQIQLKALNKKIQLCHKAINQNQKPDFVAIEETVAEMVENAYKEVHVEKEKVILGSQVLNNLASPEDSADIRKLFRKFAKELHPDINPNLTEEELGLWNEVYDAYKSGDLDRLKALDIIHFEFFNKAQKSLEDLSEEEILLQTAKLKDSVSHLEKQIADLNKEFPFNLAEQIRDEEWIKEQQDLVQNDILDFKKALAEKQEIYQLIRETYG